jgi:SAM-dependent methyltransferase
VETGVYSYSGTELDALGQAPNYYRWILSHFQPHLGRRVLEVGAGIGTLSERLLAQPGVDHVIAVEPARNLFPRLAERLSSHPRATLVHGGVDDVPVSTAADCAVLVNVLEHVEDVPPFLAALRARLTPDGRLLLLVPAGPALYGSLDRAFGHFRRYTKPALARALGDAGFRPRVLRYLNLVGVLGWFVAGRVMRRRTLRARDVALYDRLVVPWLSRLEARWPPPCGQSLVAIADRSPDRTLPPS